MKVLIRNTWHIQADFREKYDDLLIDYNKSILDIDGDECRVIEVPTIEALFNLSSVLNQDLIIINDSYYVREGLVDAEIEIYDDYRE